MRGIAAGQQGAAEQQVLSGLPLLYLFHAEIVQINPGDIFLRVGFNFGPGIGRWGRQ